MTERCTYYLNSRLWDTSGISIITGQTVTRAGARQTWMGVRAKQSDMRCSLAKVRQELNDKSNLLSKEDHPKPGGTPSQPNKGPHS